MILFFHKEVFFVKGYNRTCIYDLPKNNYDFISNDFVAKIQKLEFQERDYVYSFLDLDDIEWLEFLLEKEYCFFMDKSLLNCFPNIDTIWKSSSIITNSILDINTTNDFFNLKDLEDLNCKHIVFRFTNNFPIDSILLFLKENTANLTFKSIDVIIERNDLIMNSVYKSLKKNIIQNFNQIFDIELVDALSGVFEGNFKPKFIVSLDTFLEAFNYNLFYNRKLYINVEKGYFKNGLENHKKFFFDKNSKSLVRKIKSTSFREIWSISKDKIDVCKDCEFRYMCLDNRVPIKKNNKNEYYFQDECSYNPYISLWQGNENYLTLKDINVYSTDNIFFIDDEVVKSVNMSLWEI